jgi:hypothetical protein
MEFLTAKLTGKTQHPHGHTGRRGYMSNKYVKISPSGELMGESSLVPPDYWEKYEEEEEEELLLQQWQQSENDKETGS